MKPYLIVAKNTWDEILTYRLNFVMWRFRTFLQLIGLFILWFAITSNKAFIFGYTQSQILTYILGTSFLFSAVLAGRNQEIGENINSGDLSIFLIRPWSYFKYWFFRDLGDKAMNLIFSLIEIFLILLIFKPVLFLQTSPFYLFFTLIFIFIALFLNFFISSLIGLIGFWSPEVWAPRFLSWMLISFLAGMTFPLDILPKTFFEILLFSPFTYMLFFPLKVYLGQVSQLQILSGVTISLAWTLSLYFILMFVWTKGLKKYGAEGR